MRLLRHNEIYRSDVSLTSGKLDPECRLLNGSGPSYRTHQEEYALPIVCDEFRPGIPRSGWSPPEPVFASPARPACHGWTRERKRFSANGDLSLFKLSHLRGAVHSSVPGFLGWEEAAEGGIKGLDEVYGRLVGSRLVLGTAEADHDTNQRGIGMVVA